MAQKVIKLEEQAISEILVEKQQQQASTDANHRLQQVVDYQPGDCLKEGTEIFILLSVQQKL
jgi:hypothetical protein